MSDIHIGTLRRGSPRWLTRYWVARLRLRRNRPIGYGTRDATPELQAVIDHAAAKARAVPCGTSDNVEDEGIRP